MKNSTKYFLNNLSVDSENYILHYFFDSGNFSGNSYIYNNTEYTNYTGTYFGSNLTNNLNKKTGYLFFDTTNRVDIPLKDLNINSYTFIVNYEKTGSGPCVLFSNLNTGISGQYYGFNVCVNDYNNLLIEYYDTNKNLKYLSPTYNLDTKGIVCFRGYENNIFVNYYNAAYDDFYTEAFEIDNNSTPNVTGSLVLGSGRFSNFPNYSGYIKDFILIDDNITNFQLNNVLDQFAFNLNYYYTFQKNNEFYGYENYPDNVTHIFDSYVDVTGCFNNIFLDNTGVIYGSITGSNYSLDLTGNSGVATNLDRSAFLLLKNKIKKTQIFAIGQSNFKASIILLNDGTITGWGYNGLGQVYGNQYYVGNWTGSPVGQLTDIQDVSCNTYSCLALKNDGTVTGWGWNYVGSIYGTTKDNDVGAFFTGNYSDTPLGQLTDISGISMGQYFSIFLKDDGTILSWGKNNAGQVAGINDRILPYPLKIQITDIYSDWSYLSGLILNYTGQYNAKPAYKYTNDLENFGLSLKYNNSFINKVIISNSAVSPEVWDASGSVNGIYKRRYPEDLTFYGPNGWLIEYLDNNWFLTDFDQAFYPFQSSDLITWTSADATWDGVANNYSISGWTIDYSGLNDEILITGNTSLPTNNNLNIPYQVVIENSQDTGANGLYTYNIASAFYGKNGDVTRVINFESDPNDNYWAVVSGGNNLYINSGVGSSSLFPLTGWSGNNELGYYGDITIKPKYAQLDYVYNSDFDNRFTGVFEETIVGQLTGIKKISAGTSHVYALKNDNTITGWGNNQYYQIDPYNASTMWSGNWNNNKLNLLTGVSDIVANSSAGLVLFDNNTISGWGGIGAIGLSGNYLTGVKQIGGGSAFLNALLQNEVLTGWGTNTGAYPKIASGVKQYNSSQMGTYYENITGQQVKNLVTGNINFIYNIEIERPSIITETITTIVSQISGYENQVLFSGVTGYNTGWYKDIPDFCGTGFPLYLVSGIIGVITGNVLTGIDITTSSSTSQRLVLANQTYQTSSSSGIYNASKTGNYIYEFNYTNNGSSIDGLETLYLDSGYYTLQSKNILDPDNSLIATKNSNLRYTKNYVLTRNIEFLQDLGVDLLLINQYLDTKDIIEIYLFQINSGLNISLNNGLSMSKASKDFRFGTTGLNYSVNLNGVAQITGNNYTISDINLGSPVSLYEFNDNLEGDLAKTGEVLFNYTGQTGQALSKKDFLYLNGQKLISGYQYNFNSTSISFVTGNILATGLIHGFNSLINYIRYTGNMYTFDLPRFSKNSELIWLNGIKLKSDSYYEISENDKFYNPTFYDKSTVIIYNNTDNYFNA
jgi:alpha-tubulin suppressor-like RCC1 family protein